MLSGIQAVEKAVVKASSFGGKGQIEEKYLHPLDISNHNTVGDHHSNKCGQREGKYPELRPKYS